jgi:cell division protease FtsH
VFLGRDIGNKSNISEAMAGKVDAEIRVLIDKGYERCLKVIKGHMTQLEALTTALLEHETLDGKQIESLLAGNGVGKVAVKAKVEVAKVKRKTSKVV